jgi:hypothetical protein
MTREQLRNHLPVAGTLLAAGAVLFFFNPVEHRFFPPCLFQKLTGWYCPGCGATRALHQLLHGNVGAALRCNALLVLSLPIPAWVTARFFWRQRRGETGRQRRSGGWMWWLIAPMLIFAVWRNLPSGAWLAP